VREAAAERAAISRLNVTYHASAGEAAAPRGDRVVALHDALSCARPGPSDVLFDLYEFSSRFR